VPSPMAVASVAAVAAAMGVGRPWAVPRPPAVVGAGVARLPWQAR